ncbi:FAD/NAD(P)-binding domain-containing protein [Mycena leptocephala]|nr:FAD/NAD(P)-binding domain-containing protein [Mycena leptocephala]
MAHPADLLRPLNVAIVGAGIGGLAAAVALRRNGHHIRIFEASQIKTEIGAGVGIPRNALRILKLFGYSRDNLKAVDFDGTVVFDAKTGTSITLPWLISCSDENRELCCHRSDLHDELKRLATDEGDGPPAELLLGSKVVACDPEAGTVTLGSGEIVQADIVIGADGVHSVVRTSIVGSAVTPTSDWSCFRCLFDASSVNEIPELEWLTEGLSGARSVAWREGGPLRMFFIYRCRSGTLVNFVGFYTDSNQGDPDWTPTATRDEILETFDGFHPKFLRLMDLPAASPILKWQIKVAPLLPTWIRGRTALLGDSAHATLPLLGQGLALAVEEAAMLGCLLPRGTTRDEVPARLEAYQQLRKERGEYVNTESAAQAAVPEKRGTYLRSREMQAFLLEHDAVKTAQEYYDAHFGSGKA